MNSIVARVLLSSIGFLLPLIVAAQADDSLHSIELTAQDPETGEDLPTADGKASIEGTPGDGVRDYFNYRVTIIQTPWFEEDPGPLADKSGRLELDVRAWDDDQGFMINRTEVIEPIIVDPDFVAITGRIDLSADTELGQVLRYFGSFTIPGRPVAEFVHDVTVGCQCPRAGRWTAYNAPGRMVCTGLASITLPLAASTQTGTLEVSNECQSLFATNFDDEYAYLLMDRVPGQCGYEGEAQGAGIPMVIGFNWDVHNEELITGSLHSELVQQGATCIMTREFEVQFDE